MKTGFIAALCGGLLTLSLLPGCGGDSGATDSAGSSDLGQDLTGDTDSRQDAGDDQVEDLAADLPSVTPGTAILERTPDIQFECSVTRDTTNHEPRRWSQSSHTLITTTAGFFLARSESTPPSPFEYAPYHLRIGAFGVDGSFGKDIDIAANAESISGIGAALVGNGFLLAWADGSIHTSVRDASGAQVTAPQGVDSVQTDYMTQPMLAPLGEQMGLVAAVSSGSGHLGRFLRLDAQGTKLGGAVDFATAGGQWTPLAPSVAAGQGRWGVAWQEDDQTKGSVYFAALDEQGNLVVSRKRISAAPVDGVKTAPSGFAKARTTILAIADGWLVAWSEVREGIDFMSGASSIIQIARLDAEGNVLERAPVRNIVVDTDEVEPLFIPFQGTAGLFWSTGSHIYMCGGCWPNHRVDFVLLDPLTLVRVSDVQTLSPTPNGLLDLSASVNGDDILVTAEINYHVYQDPASAALACTRR